MFMIQILNITKPGMVKKKKLKLKKIYFRDKPDFDKIRSDSYEHQEEYE